MCVLIELELDTRTFGRVEMVIRELCVVMTCLMMTIQIHTTFYKTWGHRLMCGYKSRRHDVYEQLNWEKGRDPTNPPNIYTDRFRFNWKLEKIRLVTNVTNVTNVCLLGSWQTDNCHDIYCRQQSVPQLTPNVVTLPSNSHGFKPAVKVSHQNF